MRIAYVCMDPGVPVFGWKGASVHVQEVVRACLRHGAQVELVAANLGGEPPADLASVRLHHIGIPVADRAAAREQAQLRANDHLRESLQLAEPFDMVYERHALWSFAGMEYARATPIPGLLEVNAPLIDEQATHRILVDRRWAERAAERSFAAATALLAVSNEVARYLDQYVQARGRIHVIPNGVDLARFPEALRASHPSSPGTFTVGFVGSLKPWHGLPALVDACALLYQQDPRLRVLIVGDGPERARLLESFSAHGLRRVAHFTGAVSPTEVPGLLVSMDAAVAPYQVHPSFYFSPLKVYEYMAAGLPIVASRIGQLATLIDDGVTGLLCPPGDAAALAAALMRLRADPALRARLGQQARTAVLADHTWDARIRRVFALAGFGAVPATSAQR